MSPPLSSGHDKNPKVEGSRSYQSSVTPLFKGTKAPKTRILLCFGAVREAQMIRERSLLTSLDFRVFSRFPSLPTPELEPCGLALTDVGYMLDKLRLCSGCEEKDFQYISGQSIIGSFAVCRQSTSIIIVVIMITIISVMRPGGPLAKPTKSSKIVTHSL